VYFTLGIVFRILGGGVGGKVSGGGSIGLPPLNLNLYYRVSKKALVSLGINNGYFGPPAPSIGFGITY